jgi:hypothetical protein
MIVWAVPAGSDGAPAEGRGARERTFFLTNRRLLRFFRTEKAGSPFHARQDGGYDWCEAKKGVKPLKTNNFAKCALSRLQ